MIPVDSVRRNFIRTLTGGSALALLPVATTPAAAAVPVPQDADPFVLEEFRPSGRVREYWIQAESFEHNAVPNGHDAMTGMRFKAEQTTFWAIGFRAWTPDFGAPLPADLGPQGIGANSGIPGPVLRAEVGDTIVVHFRNNDTHYKWPHSMHPHGVQYDRDNDGGWRADDPGRLGTAVPYGGGYTYTWTARPDSVGTWPYHDHAEPQHDVMELGAELGLFGILAITDRHTPPVDREFVLFLHELYGSDVPSLPRHTDLVNGSAFVDNTPTLTARRGDRVRWRLAALGREFHVFHIHGHRWRSREGWTDSQILGPATTLTIEYTEDNPGDWLYHCHLGEHMTGGMVGRYLVSP